MIQINQKLKKKMITYPKVLFDIIILGAQVFGI